MPEYMEKERTESAKRQKEYLGWLKKEEAAEFKAKEAETGKRLKDFEGGNRAWEKKLGTEIE